MLFKRIDSLKRHGRCWIVIMALAKTVIKPADNEHHSFKQFQYTPRENQRQVKIISKRSRSLPQ